MPFSENSNKDNDEFIGCAPGIENDENKGIGALFVDAKTKGLKLGPPENKMGWKSSDTRSVYFDQMEIPSNNILGEPNKGFKQFLKTLTGGRISIAALSLRQIAFLEVLIGKENTQVCSGFVTSDSCGIPLLAKN